MKSDNSQRDSSGGWGAECNKQNSQGERKLVDSRLCFPSCGVLTTVPEDSALPNWWILELKTQQLGFAVSRILFIA